MSAPPFEKFRRLACVAVGHKFISGRGFLAEGEAIDLKWKACRRCLMFFPEGGFEQVEHEIEVAKKLQRERETPHE